MKKDGTGIAWDTQRRAVPSMPEFWTNHSLEKVNKEGNGI
jgi:hypothetical protein